MEFETAVSLLIMQLRVPLSESFASDQEKRVALEELLDEYMVKVHNRKLERSMKREYPGNAV